MSKKKHLDHEEYEIRCDGEYYASVSGPSETARKEALQYVQRYEWAAPDEKVEVFKITRERVTKESLR